MPEAQIRQVLHPVADVGDAVGTFVAAGGSIIRPPEDGPHETRAVVHDPWGNVLVIYGRP